MGRGTKRKFTVYRDSDDVSYPDIPQARMLTASKDGRRIWPTPRSPQKIPANRPTQTRLDVSTELDGSGWEGSEGLGNFGEDDTEADASTAEADVVVVQCHRLAKRYPTSVSFVYVVC